ncbi:cystatin-11 [Erinaceus europaeus]|uniref:Cystatin-11 n=1 Tax=Erinaceus europaeus TaxID=9365 RepID=A0A1S2ZX83_ERIEU|nr:cystatin-11 [Erinaceus europaeus]
MMIESKQVPRLLLAILVALVALTYQQRKKTFMFVNEEPATEASVVAAMNFVSDQFNKENEDKYRFRIVRVLKVLKIITNIMEYRVNLEMLRTTCLKPETVNCTFQEGNLYKKISCYFSVYNVPGFEIYKILKKNCTDGN